MLTFRCQQAEKLDDLLEKRGIGIDRVLNFDVPDSTLVGLIFVSTLSPTCIAACSQHTLPVVNGSADDAQPTKCCTFKSNTSQIKQCIPTQANIQVQDMSL